MDSLLGKPHTVSLLLASQGLFCVYELPLSPASFPVSSLPLAARCCSCWSCQSKPKLSAVLGLSTSCQKGPTRGMRALVAHPQEGILLLQERKGNFDTRSFGLLMCYYESALAGQGGALQASNAVVGTRNRKCSTGISSVLFSLVQTHQPFLVDREGLL